MNQIDFNEQVFLLSELIGLYVFFGFIFLLCAWLMIKAALDIIRDWRAKRDNRTI